MQTQERRIGTVVSVLDELEVAALADDRGADGPVVCLWPDEVDVPDRVAAALHEAATHRPVIVLRHGPVRQLLVDCRGETHELARLDVAAGVEDVLRRDEATPSGLHEERLDPTTFLPGGDR